MFKNVIVGVDGKDGSRDAIVLARRLVERDGALTLAYVYWDETHVWRGSNADFDLAEREQAHELLERTREEAEIDAQLRWHGSSSVGRGLHEVAEAADADLLIIGSPNSGLLGRIHVTQSIHDALNGAPCAVALAPAGYSHEPSAMREIGVGYDGSPESEHAIAVAREIARQHDAKLSAFEAISVPTAITHRHSASSETTIDDLVAQARDQIAALGGVEPHAAYGNPAEELALYGASLDLLVIGSRGYGPRKRLVHGSTASHLARRARCPLLVLTRSAREHTTNGDAGAAGRAAEMSGA
ncbi:MAG TPA: universal stress protein, partial [Solirubrobacteraceae bacterium]|nr:universal stress protein [Solirubrobacteraceae bacterium]